MHRIVIEPSKSYATESNAAGAAFKKYGHTKLRYFIMKYEGDDAKHNGRYFPVFVGQSAIDEGVHFHFNVVS